MSRRLKKVHAKFLESCRSLSEGRGYWDDAGPIRKWFAQLITPVPLMALDEEAKPLYEALQWLEANSRSRAVSEEIIRQYHRMLRPNSPEPPGEYRRGKIVMEGSVHTCPPPQRVPMLMKQFDIALHQEQKRLDGLSPTPPAELLRAAVGFHFRLVEIHPFADANGRLARLVMNHVLRRYGQPYVILPALSESKEHFDALQEAHLGKPERLYSFAERHYFRV